MENKLNPECGKRLKECIADAGMTQGELAERAGFTQQYISNIVTGKKPMTTTAAKQFAKYLCVPEGYLLCEHNSKNDSELEKAHFNKLSTFDTVFFTLLASFGIVLDRIDLKNENGEKIYTINRFISLFTSSRISEVMESIDIHPAEIVVYGTIDGRSVEIPFDDVRQLVQDIFEYAEFKAYKFAKPYTNDPLPSIFGGYFR